MAKKNRVIMSKESYIQTVIKRMTDEINDIARKAKSEDISDMFEINECIGMVYTFNFYDTCPCGDYEVYRMLREFHYSGDDYYFWYDFDNHNIQLISNY